MKKLLTRLALLLLLCAALTLPALADAVTDSVSVCIGYFGWSEEEYVEKARFSWQELDDWYGGSLDTHEEFYSYSNGGGRADVSGFCARVLYPGSAGIRGRGRQLHRVHRLFYEGSLQRRVPLVHEIRPFRPAALLLPESGRGPGNGRAVRVGRRRRSVGRGVSRSSRCSRWRIILSGIPPAMILRATWMRACFRPGAGSICSSGSPARRRPRPTRRPSMSIKFSSRFSGTPVLSSEESNLDLVIGSDHALHVTADAEDDALSGYVQEHLQYASSDPSVVSVDQYGKLHVNAEGDAVITASFGESSVSVNVHVGSGGASGMGSAAGTGAEAGGEAAAGTLDLPQPDETDTPDRDRAGRGTERLCACGRRSLDRRKRHDRR